MTPRSARDFPPRMVYVLPVPVAPYAKIVTLIPLNNCFTVGETCKDQLQVFLGGPSLGLLSLSKTVCCTVS